jgi:RimJ/RimL family protein N-acetyltransferase
MTDQLALPERVETERLLLRGPVISDAQQLFESYTSDACVTRFLSWRPHASAEETKAYINACLARWAIAAGSPYFIESKASRGKAIGAIKMRRQGTRVSFGFVLSRHHWGHSLMPEALRALTDWALRQSTIWRASAACDAENVASARVMEKAGMAFEGILRRAITAPNMSPEPRDCRLYAKVR